MYSQNEKSNSDPSLTIVAVGDISLGDHPVCVGHGMRTAFKKQKGEILGSIQHHFVDADIAIGNLEGTTSNIGFKRGWLPSYEMRGNPEHLVWLKNAGFNVLSIANNHAMQHGIEAFYDTQECLNNQDIAIIGIDDNTGTTQPYRIKHDNVESAIFAISTRPEEWTKESVPYSLREDKTQLLNEISILRSKYSGFLICSIHWGLEFLDYPDAEQIALGHELIDAGCDVILGHHPHVLQPVEEYKSGIIFYSLGNFVFDLWPDETKLTAIAKITLNKSKKNHFATIPVIIDNNYSLKEAGKKDADRIMHLLDKKRCHREFENPTPKEHYIKHYKSKRKEFRYSSYRYFLKNIFKYPPHFLIQSLARTALRRLTGQ